MNADTAIDLDKLHLAIATDIKARFPELATVEFYRGEGHNDRKSLPVPACLLDLTEFEASPSDNSGSGQLSVVANFEAALVISFKTPDAKRKLRKLAASVAAWLHNHRWVNPDNTAKRLPTGPCEVIGAYRDDFQGMMAGERDRPLDQFEIWKVEWRQKVDLGESVWNETGLVPNQIFLGISPEIGPDHVDDYVQVAGTP